jgi:hypothetical protein
MCISKPTKGRPYLGKGILTQKHDKTQAKIDRFKIHYVIN